MSEPTLSELIAQERKTLRSSATKPKATTASEPILAARRASRVEPEVHDFDKLEGNGFDHGFAGFSVGVLDTVTFGFADEGIAGIISPFNGKSYDENLKLARGVIGRYEEEHTASTITGQIAGGFVPVAGWGGRLAGAARAGNTASVGRMALEGAAFGGLYGYGSADADDLFSQERVENGLYNAALGAAGGFVMGTAIFQGTKLAKAGYQKAVSFGSGKSPKLDFDYAPIGGRKPTGDDVIEDLTEIRQTNKGAPSGSPKEAPTVGGVVDDVPTKQSVINRITGKSADELEDGALASAGDIISGAKKEALFSAIAKLTPTQAKQAAQKLQDAMATGDLTKEPHFRSILGLDLSEFGDEEILIPQIADMLTEMGEEVLQKAGAGKTTTKSLEDGLRARYGDSITEGQLDSLVEKVKDTRGSANTGRLVMTLAGVKFARVTKDLMPEVLKGNREARESLADELSTALRVSAKGQLLLSEAGRNLGMLSHSKSLLLKEVDGSDVIQDKALIAENVRKAFDQLDDNGLNELLAATRDLSNLEEISAVLLDPARAEKVGLWMRTRNTFESFIKSNTLTPATAVINLVGVPIHDWVRNSGARKMAALTAKAAGNDSQAMILQMSSQAANVVRWNAHLEGIKAATRRVRWEVMGSVKSIASVAGASKTALKMGASRSALIARGYRPPTIREFDLKKRLAVTDTEGFNARLAERAASDAPLASLVNAMERVGATALNTVDALGTATAKVASGVIDDYGRAMIMTKEVYAEMAGKATQEALEKGVPEAKIADYVSKRAKEWSTIPPEDILARVEQKLIKGADLDEVDRMLVRRDYAAEKEAERVLFLDGAQTSVGRAFATVADAADTVAGVGQFKGILMPYISTPTRILERGLASYTPWGHLTKESSELLAKGGVDAAMERARMEIGGTIISAGMLAAASGAITVTNGADYRNSANLGGAPANRLNLPGGGYVEFGRLEPLALGLAMGGVIGQMWRAAQDAGDKYGQDDAMAEAFAIAYGGFRDALLEKSYLTGLNDLFEAVSSNDDAALTSYMAKFVPDAAARVIPLSGTMRQLNDTISGKSVEALSALDRLAKVTPGMGAYLPARVDALGNEIEGRTMGIAAGTTADLDEVTAKVRDLGIDLTNLRKADPTGFDLTSEELSELRTIRATEALNSDGVTMKEALAELFTDPEFQALPDKEMVEDAVVKVMGKFNEPARKLYEDRNQQYLADREAKRSLKLYIQDGLSNKDAQNAARDEIKDFGLPDPTRVGQ